jgi:signal transduction histidine kinase
VRSLRLRLTGAFVGIAGVLIVAAGLGTRILVERAVWGPLDAALLEEATTIEALWDRHRPDEFNRMVRRIGEETDLGHGKFLRITEADGRVLSQAGTWVGDAPPAPSAARLTDALTLVRGDHTFRLVRYPHADGGWMELGVSADDERRALMRSHVAMLLGSGFLLVTLATLAWMITTRSVNELERLAGELETLEAGSLGRRISPRRTTEVDRVVTVLNRLLGRLEAAVTHLRRFAGEAAHELRTPVAALRARLEVAVEGETSLERYRNGLLDALEQTERIERLAEGLLTLTAIEQGSIAATARRAPVRLDQLAREVGEAFEPVAQEQGRPFVWRAPDPVVVSGSESLLKRLLLNLVDNAFRHTPHGAPVELTVLSTNGTAHISVIDRGPGIPPHELPRLFERFRRGATGGSGLGLAICREIIAAEGGQLRVESSAETGTTVTVTLRSERADPGSSGT